MVHCFSLFVHLSVFSSRHILTYLAIFFLYFFVKILACFPPKLHVLKFCSGGIIIKAFFCDWIENQYYCLYSSLSFFFFFILLYSFLRFIMGTLKFCRSFSQELFKLES